METKSYAVVQTIKYPQTVIAESPSAALELAQNSAITVGALVVKESWAVKEE